MEGVLWKWTNYWNGWQTRWFKLDNGILSYYKSQEEVSQGCKGSVRVMVCQINVSTLDPTRLDLVIPGEHHMYLRAPTPQERQQWLVALGSAKACVDKPTEAKSAVQDPNSLKSKKSELRLYCDLMMQQVHAIKNATCSDGGPNVEKMDDATRLLTVTCDTFIETLEDCMKLANASTGNQIVYETSPSLPLGDVILSNRSHSQNSTSHKNSTRSLDRSQSQENT